MEISKALLLGVQAYKKKDFVEADRLFSWVIRRDPDNFEAYFAMGQLAADCGKVNESIKFFANAVKINPRNEDAIEALVAVLANVNRHDEAMQIINNLDLASEFVNKLCDAVPFLKRLLNNQKIDEFYNKQLEFFVMSAAVGWLYNLSYDFLFLQSDAQYEEPIRLVHRNKVQTHKQSFHPKLNIKNMIEEIRKSNLLAEKIEKIENYNAQILKRDWKAEFDKIKNFEIKKYFGEQKNILIFGAGPCGLYLSNALKSQVEAEYNVCVIDMVPDYRLAAPAFSRQWLTHIKFDQFSKYFSFELNNVLASFGKNGFIGLPLNLIECVLFLSAKDKGVNFFATAEINFGALNLQQFDFVFDATGGRMQSYFDKIHSKDEIHLKVKNKAFTYSSAGVKSVGNYPFNKAQFVNFSLKKQSVFYEVFCGNYSLNTTVLKITKIPIAFQSSIMKFIKDANSDNRFYIWAGDLQDDINELLLLINLSTDEAKILEPFFREPRQLNDDIVALISQFTTLDSRILEVFKFIVHSNPKDDVNIEPIFTFKPRINLNPTMQKINGSSIYPVGDSVFFGNPKVGNGLGNHLIFISSLVDQIDKVLD